MTPAECECRTWTHPGPFPPATFWPEGEGHHPACDHYTAPPGVEWVGFELVPMPDLGPEARAIFETWIGSGWIPEQLELEPAGALRAIEILFNPYPPFVRVELCNAGPEMVTVTPLLLGREAPFREASLGGPVSEANERGPVRGRPNLPSDFAAGSWNMRAQRCELCTGDPKQEGCEGYCPVRDEASVGFSWDALERQVADVEAVVLYGSLFPPTEHAGDFTDEQSYTLAHLGADLATYVRRHLLDFRPPEPRSSDVGGKAAGA